MSEESTRTFSITIQDFTFQRRGFASPRKALTKFDGANQTDFSSILREVTSQLLKSNTPIQQMRIGGFNTSIFPSSDDYTLLRYGDSIVVRWSNGMTQQLRFQNQFGLCEVSHS